MSSKVVIRPATAADVSAITEIYRYHVLHGSGSFEIAPPDEEEVAKRLEEIVRRGLPWLVAEMGGVVAGYAYAGLCRAREAYRFTLEDSIYVRPEAMGQGVGRLLLEKLIEACRNSGYKQLIAVIAVNDVMSKTTIQCVITAATTEGIITRSAIDEVIVIACCYYVVTVTTI